MSKRKMSASESARTLAAVVATLGSALGVAPVDVHAQQVSSVQYKESPGASQLKIKPGATQEKEAPASTQFKFWFPSIQLKIG